MKIVFVVYLLLVVLSVFTHADDSTEESKVVKLTHENIKQCFSSGAWMIRFITSWCSHCSSLTWQWEEYAKLVDGIYKVAEVDCETDAPLCRKLGIHSYPFFLWVEEGHTTQVLNCPLLIHGWVRWVQQNSKNIMLKKQVDLPDVEYALDEHDDIFGTQFLFRLAEYFEDATSKVTVLTEKNFAESMASGPWLVEFYSPSCTYCKQVIPVMEELARTQMAEGLYQVGKVHTSDNYGLVEKYDVEKLPRFMLFNVNSVPRIYEGTRTAKEIDAWVKDQITPKREEL